MPNYAIKSFQSVTAVAHQMVLRAPSGVNAAIIAEIVGYTNYHTMLSELGRQPRHKLGADMLLPLMDACGSHAPLEFMARECGGVFLQLPQPAECGHEMLASLAKCIKEFGEFVTEVIADFADGDIPKDQLDRINKEGIEAVMAILAVKKLARVTHEAQYASR